MKHVISVIKDHMLHRRIVCCWSLHSTNSKLCDDEACDFCHKRSFASHEKAIHWSPKNKVSPREVTISSGRKFFFDCDVCNHSFDKTVSNITHNEQWCPYCCGKRLCSDEACDLCHENSFASSEKVQFLSPTNKVIPRQVFKSARMKCRFDCGECGHSFEISLRNVAIFHWCPYCATTTKLCNDEACNFCHENSFASHEKAIHWSPRNKVTSRQVAKSSSSKFIFDCDVCNHSFDTTLGNITHNKHWCPYCATTTKLCNDEACNFCHENSFASHEKAIHWSPKNTDTPRQLTKSSSKMRLFDCNMCSNTFKIKMCHITHNSSWCPYCKNKTELKLYEFLKTIYPNIVAQFRKSWCKKKLLLRFDFCITELKIIIELDGGQHFKQVSNWKSPEATLQNDKFKEKCANENGYSVIRIVQTDVWYDNYDWKTELIDMITEVAKCPTVENKFLCKNNEYEKHIAYTEFRTDICVVCDE